MDIDPEKYPGIAKLLELEQTDNIPEWAESSIARDFAERHKDNLRYVHEWGKWYRYHDGRWLADKTLYAYGAVRDLCDEIASRQEDRRVTGVASARGVHAVTQLARADRTFAATTVHWDADHLLLNCPTKTIDLRTGVIREQRAADFITKKTACDCAPLGTPFPQWDAFLCRVTDHSDELIGFLQRYAGYCLTGLTHEHVFVFAHGTGGNGKGTFLNTVSDVLGDYATVADTGTFIASRWERHPTDLAHLVGARLVVAQETQEGRRWNEALIKQMTGGDTMSARFMRQDYFTFKPSHKLFITGNHKPTISTVDPAMRRRLLLVPFTVQIPPDERDPTLREKLIDEWPAILRWMVAGALGWQRAGLQIPSIVREASDQYFADEDTLGQWLAERVDVNDCRELTTSRDLFGDWRTWCDDRSHRSGSQKDFTKKLMDKGLEYKRTEKARGFYVRLHRA